MPIRFGADALGGAINLVTDRRYETGVGSSYEIGSFGTQRVTGSAAYRHDDSGFVANAMGFYDYSDNDYEVNVEVPDARGRLSAARVPRFHDAYEAGGGTAEVGFVELPWAKQILLRAYSVALEKDIQHNIVMSVPYGEAVYGQTASGATARYEHELSERLELELVTSYAYRTSTFVDKRSGSNDWFGDRVRERRTFARSHQAHRPGLSRHNVYGRVGVEYAIAPEHVLTFITSPS